jgi:DNA repair protein RadC
MNQEPKYPTAICQWPKEDRPREKMMQYGEQALSNSELLAILLRTGTKGQSALDLARKVIHKFKTFRNMSHTDTRDWLEFKGVGTAKIAQIKAALEIGRRFREDETRLERPQIKSAKDVVDILMPQMRDLKKEVFKVVFLNSQNRIIAIEDLEEGTVNHAAPIIREIFQRALQHFAVSIICVHNHPAGKCEPSREDIEFTNKLTEAGRAIEVKLLDHLIIGDDCYYNFSDKGLMG